MLPWQVLWEPFLLQAQLEGHIKENTWVRACVHVRCVCVCARVHVYMHQCGDRLRAAAWVVMTFTSFQVHHLPAGSQGPPPSTLTDIPRKKGKGRLRTGFCLQFVWWLAHWEYFNMCSREHKSQWGVVRYFLGKHPHTHMEHSAFRDIMIFFKVKDVVVQYPILLLEQHSIYTKIYFMDIQRSANFF